MNDVPMPLEWHPAYAGRTELIDWLNEIGPYAKLWDLKIAEPSQSVLATYGQQEPIAGPSFRVKVLTRQRCVGLAPYVGKPFVYEWNAAVDELGRGIAGESHIEYLPEWKP